jgi:hypothetical protein
MHPWARIVCISLLKFEVGHCVTKQRFSRGHTGIYICLGYDRKWLRCGRFMPDSLFSVTLELLASPGICIAFRNFSSLARGIRFLKHSHGGEDAQFDYFHGVARIGKLNRFTREFAAAISASQRDWEIWNLVTGVKSEI